MKTTVRILQLTCFLLLFFSCEKEDLKVKEGFIQFNYSPDNSGGRLLSEPEPAAVLVSIKHNDVLVKQKLKLSLFSFGTGYLSESVQLAVGSYQLVEFLVLDADNHIIYASPIEGSEQAQFVTDPLPINFEVTENGSSTVVPEVLPVTSDHTPESFGYVNFGFGIIETNSMKFTLDGVTWQAEEVDPVVFNTDGNWLGIMGRTFTNETTYEYMFIFIQDYDFTEGEMPQDKIHLNMGLDVSLPNGTGDFYNTLWGEPMNVKVSITEYDADTGTISGTFSGYLYSQTGGVKKVVTNGVFYKLKMM